MFGDSIDCRCGYSTFRCVRSISTNAKEGCTATPVFRVSRWVAWRRVAAVAGYSWRDSRPSRHQLPGGPRQSRALRMVVGTSLDACRLVARCRVFHTTRRCTGWDQRDRYCIWLASATGAEPLRCNAGDGLRGDRVDCGNLPGTWRIFGGRALVWQARDYHPSCDAQRQNVAAATTIALAANHTIL
jgi:hypothetical protein